MKSGQHRFAWACGLVLLSVSLTSWAGVPQLFGSAYNEAPVRGDPDDLLLLSGYPLAPTDTVVYQSVGDTTAPLTPPTALPTQTTASSGFADIVSTADLPYSLTVHLPSAVTAGQSYALWVHDASGSWSNGVLINDARPLWFTPDTLYQTAATAGLPRQLKIVGRNLEPAPAPNTRTLVRLTGPATYAMTAANVSNDSTTTLALERYVAKVNLPANMVPGTYTVQVSRDGTGWVPLAANSPVAAQTLTVKADPVAPAQFSVSDPAYGGCQPNHDVTSCLQSAIAAAHAAGTGIVTLGAGTWQLNGNSGVQADGVGVVFPPGVSLQGAGAGSTTIERTMSFPGGTPSSGYITIPTFTLQGGNQVQGITFRDDNVYTPSSSGAPMLKIGPPWFWKNNYYAHGVQAKRVSTVIITHNTFDKPFFAIGNGDLPMDHVYITYNVFGGAYSNAIYLGNDPNYANDPDSVAYPYQLGDSVVAYNTFYPSSYVSTDLTQGAIASQIAGGQRLDFSNNIADGTATQYFYNPGTDKKGWRAAYFWSIGEGQEMALVSQNSASCPGDKAGDGEAITYDQGSEWGGFVGPQPAGAPPPGAGAVPVISAASGSGSSTVTLQGSLVTIFPTSNGNGPTTINTDYYKGFWLQVVQGPGLGQWRKISAVSPGSGSVTFTVAPAFDVLPQAGSLALIARGYWQNATVSNFVDQRQPLCTKANPRRPSGGTISWYASTADSAMEGNEQHDTDGILLNHVYRLPGTGSSPDAVSFGSAIQSSNEVRNNLVDGEYQWTSVKSDSGIQLFYGATHDTAAPPVLGYGTTVAGNTINHADTANPQPVNQSLGALGLGPGWWAGPLDATGVSGWKMADANLLFHNTLNNIAYSASDGLDRLGIGLDRAWGTSTVSPIAWRSVLYGNTCNNVSTLLSDAGTGTVYYCPVIPGNSCECAQITSVRVTAGGSTSVPNGAAVSYTILVRNSGGTTATGVTFSVEPPSGIQITSMRPVPSGQCDISTYTCNLGNMPGSGTGSLVRISVSGTATAPGSWPVQFTATHQDGDQSAPSAAGQIVTTVTP